MSETPTRQSTGFGTGCHPLTKELSSQTASWRVMGNSPQGTGEPVTQHPEMLGSPWGCGGQRWPWHLVLTASWRVKGNSPQGTGKPWRSGSPWGSRGMSCPISLQDSPCRLLLLSLGCTRGCCRRQSTASCFAIQQAGAWTELHGVFVRSIKAPALEYSSLPSLLPYTFTSRFFIPWTAKGVFLALPISTHVSKSCQQQWQGKLLRGCHSSKTFTLKIARCQEQKSGQCNRNHLTYLLYLSCGFSSRWMIDWYGAHYFFKSAENWAHSLYVASIVNYN